MPSTTPPRPPSAPSSAPLLPLAPGPVVCVGETMAALVPEPVGPLAVASGLALAVAGAESNVAMYLADHGVPVRWVSAVGVGSPLLGDAAEGGSIPELRSRAADFRSAVARPAEAVAQH